MWRSRVQPDAAPGLEQGFAEKAHFCRRLDLPHGLPCLRGEIDPETGSVRPCAISWSTISAPWWNPLLLAGQVHGGVARARPGPPRRRALRSCFGQLLTGSFMDYCMPRADDCRRSSSPGTSSPCAPTDGLKGAGEAGAIGRRRP